MAFDDAVYTIQEISDLLGAGVSGVKQVASGTHNFVASERESGATITTGITVNPAKTVVLVQSRLGGISYSSSSSTNFHRTFLATLTAKTETAITLSCNYADRGSGQSNYEYGGVSWQLIEFF